MAAKASGPQVVKYCPMSDVSEYETLCKDVRCAQLELAALSCQEHNPTPLYSLVRKWVYEDG